MSNEIFFVFILLFLAISYGMYKKEGFSRSGDYRADMFGSNSCPMNGKCRQPIFDNSMSTYLL